MATEDPKFRLAPLERERIKKRSAQTKPLKLPAKGKPIRRAGVRTINGYRAFLRGKDRVQKVGSKATSWVGAQYRCNNCGEWVLYRQANDHNARCKWEQDELAKIRKEQERIETRGTPELASVTPIERRRPSRTKTEARKRGGWIPPTGQGVPDAGTPFKSRRTRRKETREAPEPSPTRKAWEQKINDAGDDMAGRTRASGSTRSAAGAGGASSNGATPSSTLAGNVVKAVQAWADHQPETVADLKAHLLGMDAALGQVPDLLHGFAANAIVGRRIHPAVAQPVDAAADDFAAIRHRFTEAYIRFEQIYAARLEYERQQGPKPDDALFSQVD